MKKLLAISFSMLFLTGCDPYSFLGSKVLGPKFKVGECMALKSDIKRLEGEDLERWENKKDQRITIELILEVGENKYHTVQDFGGIGHLSESSSRFSYDGIMDKIECSNGLKEIKKELFK